MKKLIQIVECPRDAMQGIHDFIPTEIKVDYLNLLLKVGFDVLDFGSFVSPKAIPQLRDTSEVLEGLDLADSSTDLLAIVANHRGVVEACGKKAISLLGFPFSVSETFQKRNTNSTISESFKKLKEYQDLCLEANKTLLVYLSMSFGNPYGDEFSPEVVYHWTEQMNEIGIRKIAFADTIGVSNAESIKSLYADIVPNFTEIEFGVHLHSTPETAKAKIEAALNAGCTKFDVAFTGMGGCPMATDSLTGNLATEQLINCLDEQEDFALDIDRQAYAAALAASRTLYGNYQ